MAFTTRMLGVYTLPCGNLTASHNPVRQKKTAHAMVERCEATLHNHGPEKKSKWPGHRKQMHVCQRMRLNRKTEPNNIEPYIVYMCLT